jgi:hypothetical protein
MLSLSLCVCVCVCVCARARAHCGSQQAAVECSLLHRLHGAQPLARWLARGACARSCAQQSLVSRASQTGCVAAGGARPLPAPRGASHA